MGTREVGALFSTVIQRPGSFLKLMQQGKSGGSHLCLPGVAVGYITSTSVPLATAQSYPNFSAAS